MNGDWIDLQKMCDVKHFGHHHYCTITPKSGTVKEQKDEWYESFVVAVELPSKTADLISAGMDCNVAPFTPLGGSSCHLPGLIKVSKSLASNKRLSNFKFKTP